MMIVASSHIKPGMGEEIDEDMNRDKYLLLDSRAIESTENAKLTVGTVRKDKNNPLFGEDKPCEPRLDNVFPCAIYDDEDKLYKCWYNPFIVDERATSTPKEKRNLASISYREINREIGLCYAVSKDGIHWEKPELGLVEFDGNKKNNIVMRGPHGSSIVGAVFKDLHDPDPARRYKVLLFGRLKDNKHGWGVRFSPDGINWSQLILTPEIGDDVSASHIAFWTPDLGKYVAFVRQFSEPSPRVRQIPRTESPDFVHWTKAQLVLRGLERKLQTYTMPVFPYAGIYIGLPVIFNTESDRVHAELAWSPDSIQWHRICPGTPLIANSQHMDGYDWGCIYPSPAIFRKDEVLLYYGASNGLHYGWRDGFFCLARLRPDGFAGYEQVDAKKRATITTKPVLAVADSLCLSADVAISGYVKVMLFDKENNELAESELITKTVTDAELQWPEGFSFSSLKGSEIRFAFELGNAKLYSFSFK